MSIVLKKISDPWTSIGTILGQASINDYTFYLKKFKAKKGDIIAAEAKLPTGEGKVIDVIVWGRIMEIISSNDFLPNEATKELTEENINIMDTILPLTKKDGLPELARKLFDELKVEFNCVIEELISMIRRE